MNELNPKNENPLTQEIQIPVKSELKKIGELKPRRGHTIFEFNYKTKVLSKARFEEVDAVLNTETMKVATNRRIIAHPDAIYFSALNFKNAEKKIRKNFIEHK